MSPALVVEHVPRLDPAPCIIEGQEPMGVEALVPEAAVERLDEGIVGRLAGATEVQDHAVLVGPSIERVGDELRAVVDVDALGRASVGDDGIEHGHDLRALDPLVDLDRQSFARIDIEQRQAP